MDTPVNLFSDQPTGMDGDRFSRRGFAVRIADVVTRRDDASSIVVGINAPWGEGKTSVLRMIKERLDQNGVLILEFNPWRFPDEGALLRHFFLSLALKLGIQIETKAEKFGGWLRGWAPLATITKIVSIDGEKVAQGVAGLFPEPGMDELKRRIEKHLEKERKRIVIIMDDLDRLEAKEIRAIFKLVKLTAEFNYTSYVLAFDDARVAAALKEEYGGDAEAGRSFLEKIVQVPLPLPPASLGSLLELIDDGIEAALKLSEIELTPNELNRLSEHFQKAMGPRLKSPRQCKRFANGLAFALPLMKGEVDIVDLIFIEGLKIFYPDAYSFFRAHGDLVLDYTVGDELLGRRNETLGAPLGQLLPQALSDVSGHLREGIDGLIQNLFPGLSTLNVLTRSANVGRSDDAVKEKRISTREYFWRYFSYSIQPHDVSDNEISEFLQRIPEMEDEEVASFFRQFLDEKPRSRIGTVINKLRGVEDACESATSIKLIAALSSLSDQFPLVHPDDRVYAHGVRFQIARLLMHLTNSLKTEDRGFVLKQIVEETPSLPFAFEMASMIRSFGERIESTDGTWVIVWDGLEREANQVVVGRIVDQAIRNPLEKEYFSYAQDLYLFWFFHDVVSLAEYLAVLVREGAEAVISMIAGLIRVALPPNPPESYYIQRSIPWFFILASLIDPAELYSLFGRVSPNLGHRAQKDIVSAYNDAYQSWRDSQVRM